MKKHKSWMIQRKNSHTLNKAVIIIMVLFTFNSALFSQNLDSTQKEGVNYIRLLCYSDLVMSSSAMMLSDYCDLLKNSSSILVIDTILSEGFTKDVVFLKVTFNDRGSFNQLYDSLEKEGNFMSKDQYMQGAEYFVYPFLLKKEYVFASTPSGLYKLKGFCVNDFYKFYADCYNVGDYFSNIEIRENRGKLRDKKIIKSLSVEGLDLWGLYKKYVKRKKSRWVLLQPTNE